MIVRANIRFGLHSSFLDRGFEAEDERLPGESIEDGVLRIEAALTRAEDILRQRVAAKIDGGSNVQTTPNAPYSIPTISTEKVDPNDTQALIQNAPSLEVLTTFKLLASNNTELYKAYCERLKELSK